MLIARVIADQTGLQTRLDALLAALDAAGTPVAQATMLDFCGDVLQLMLPEGEIAPLRAAIDTHLGTTDGLISSAVIQTPRLFISDMDSTMIGQECIDELADFAGLKDRIAAITERAMQGEIDFGDALRERVGLLAGLEEAAIQRCLDERIRPNPGARVLVETLKSKGCHTVLVTGGFHHFADPVAGQIGFERVVGNRLDVAGGKLTGELAGPVVDSTVKKDVLTEEMARLGEGATSLAAGDGANDIPMLQCADFGAAYYAKPKARDASNCWIDRGDLTAILSLLEIRRDEWVSI